MKQVLLRVRRVYFEDIKSGRKKVEYRKDSEHWRNMLGLHPISQASLPREETTPRIVRDPYVEKDTAVFLCGKDVYRCAIISIAYMDTPTSFSEQGKKDVDTPKCFAIHLGDEIR